MAKLLAATEEEERPPSACSFGTGSTFPLPNPVLAFQEILVSRGFILLGQPFEQRFAWFFPHLARAHTVHDSSSVSTTASLSDEMRK